MREIQEIQNMDAFPAIDLDHPKSGQCSAAWQFLQYPPTVDHGIEILWSILDNTQFMCEVYTWLQQQPRCYRRANHWQQWSGATEPNLLGIYLRSVRQNCVQKVCQYAIQQDDDALFAIAADRCKSSELASMLKSILVSSSGISCGLWILRNHNENSEIKRIAIQYGVRCSKLDVWQTIQDVFDIPLTFEIVCRMHIDLLVASYRDGLIDSHTVISVLCGRLELIEASFRTSWQDLSRYKKLLEHPKKAAKQVFLEIQKCEDVIIACPRGASRLLQKLMECEHIDQGAFELESFHFLITALSSEVAHTIFWSEQYHKTRRCTPWLQEIAKIHAIEIVGMEATLLRKAMFAEFGQLYQSITEGRDVQHWNSWQPRMTCLVSKRQLLIRGCQEFRVNSLYLYTRTRYVDRVYRITFLGIGVDRDLECEPERQVEVVNSETPDRSFRGRLPEFLIPMIRSMMPTAKSARNVLIH